MAGSTTAPKTAELQKSWERTAIVCVVCVYSLEKQLGGVCVEGIRPGYRQKRVDN